MSDNNDFTHEFVIYNSDNNNGTKGTGKFLLYDDNINAIKLENIDNIKIGGGSNGRVLATDGDGNLSWISVAAVTGGVSSYNDLTNLPNLSVYAQTANLAAVATSGSYNDLTNKPSIFSGNYADLTSKPTLVTSYNQLTDKPTIPTVPTTVSSFTNDAGYLTSVTNITGNAGTVSNGVYTTGTYANPAWITSLAYSKLTDSPSLADVATSGAYSDLTGKPTLATVATSGSYSDLTNRPTIFSGNYADLANKPVLFDGAYLSLTGLPNLAAVATSGSYNDLSNKPSIPSLDGYATEAWVTSQGYGSGSGGTGAQGPKGDKGDTGDTGPQGERAEEDRLVNGAQEVVLDSNGTLTTPAGLSISKQFDGNAVHIGSSIQSDFNKNLRLQAIGTGSGSLAWQNFEGDANFVTLNYNQSKNIMITVGNAVGEGVLHNWLFASTGNIQLPPGGDIVDIAGNSVLGGGGNANTGDWGFSSNVAYNSTSADQGLYIAPGGESTSYVYVPGNSESSSGAVQVSNTAQTGRVVVAAYNKNWQFDADGLLTVPSNGAGIKWNNPDEPPMPLGGWLANSTISFDKDLGIIFSNGVGGSGGYSWILGKDGKLKLPADGDIVDSSGNSVLGGGSGATTLSALTDVALEGPVEGSVLTWNDTQGHWENRSLPSSSEITNTDGFNTYSVSVSSSGIVTMNTARGSLEFGAQPEEGAPQHLHIMRPAGQEGSSDLYFGDDYNYVKLPSSSYSQQGVEIGSSLNNGAVSVWRFGTDGDLVLPAGKTIRNTDGDDLLNEATLPQYGYFNELVHPGDNNRVNGEAVAMDPDGNSYVSYVYYDDSESKDFGGVMKFDSTGEKLWSVNIAPPTGNARYVKIRSLEFSTFGGGSSLVAIGSYYDDAASKDVAFMYLINPATGAVGSMFDTELNASNGMELNDGVFGIDSSNNPYAVIVGSTYDQTVQKTLTPIAGSTVDKVIFSWADINASDLGNRQTIYLVENGNSYAVTINSFDVQANPAGSTEPSWTGISLSVSATESGSYIITRVNGWGAAQYSWTVPQTLTVPGASLGGVTGVNDMTFDFDRNVFNNDGANIQAAVSNIQGTPVGGGVICLASGGRDWANDIGTPLSFDYQLNNQAYIARLGTTASWTKTIGASSYEKLNSVVVDSGGNIYAVGDYDDSSNNRSSLVVKYNINGTRLWAVYIDPDNNTGNELMSIDLLSDGNLIAVDEEGTVTKLDSSDGSIIWQVRTVNGPSWSGDFKGTATPDGDYIIVNYEDDNYTMYVLKVSGADGSSIWTKRITRTINGDNGEILAQDDFSAQYIDCNATYLTIAGCSEPPSGNRVGLVFSFPISGENTDGTYGQYVISSESMDWSTESTTSTAATIVDSAMSVTGTPAMPTSTASTITVTQTSIGGGESSGSGVNIGDFVFTGSIMTATDDDLYIKAVDDLWLDALGDDVHIRANDDVRIKVGYDFQDDSAQREWRFDTDGYINFPDGSQQTTAYTGDGSSFSGNYYDLTNRPNGNTAVHDLIGGASSGDDGKYLKQTSIGVSEWAPIPTTYDTLTIDTKIIGGIDGAAGIQITGIEATLGYGVPYRYAFVGGNEAFGSLFNLGIALVGWKMYPANNPGAFVTITEFLNNDLGAPSLGFSGSLAEGPWIAESSNYSAGANGPLTLSADTKNWVLGTDGNITLPEGGDIKDTGGVSVLGKEPKFTLHYQNFNAEVSKRYCIDAVGQAVTATLPANPATGDAIFFVDAYGSFTTNNLTIVGNGKTIMGSSTLVLSTDNSKVGVFYNGAEWRTY